MLKRLDVWTAVFEKAQKEYGGVAEYLKRELVFSDEDALRIRENLESG